MAGTTVSDLNGLFKQVYGDDIVSLLPEFSHITQNTKFVKNDQRSGNFYNQPVVVQGEQGVTYAAAGAGAYALNGASTMVLQNAQLLGGQITLKATMDQESAARAVSGGASAFESATKLQTANVLESHGKRIELALLYGGTNVGTADSSANVDATHTVLTFTTASWSDATWSGMTNATISLFRTDTGAILNSNAALVITAVNTALMTLTVSGNSTDIAAIDTWVGGAGGQQAYVNFYGARTAATTYAEISGFDKIITNTGSLFGIDAAQYDLWKGNTYSAGSAALTQAKLDAAVAIAVGKGLAQKATVYVNPKTWSNLNTDQAAKRMYDSSYDPAKATNGTKTLKYMSQNGELEVVSHPFVKQGEAFIVPLDEAIRVGATEVTFNIPGQQDEYFTAMENNMGFYYKSYSNQALLINTPAKCVKITNIVNA